MPDVDPNKPNPGGQPPPVVPVAQPNPGVQRADVTVSAEVVPPHAAGAPPNPPPAAPPAAPPPEKKRAVIGAEDELPEGAELLELSKVALDSRLRRASSRQLKELFGTDNVEEVKGKITRLKELEEQEEQKRLASLSDLQKEQEARAKAEGERDEWRRKYSDQRDAQIVQSAHGRVERLAAKHVADGSTRFALFEFGHYLRSKLSEEQIDALTDDQIGQWFADLAREQPSHARPGAQPPPPPPVQTRTVPLSNGAVTVDQPPPPAAPQTAQSYSPSAPNAMNSGDARAAAAREGYRW